MAATAILGLGGLLAACSSSSSIKAQPAGAASTSAAPANTETVKIGLMNHLTGVSAGPYGIPFNKGFQLGLEQIASSGALDRSGVSLKLMDADVAGEVPAAVTTFNKFVDGGAKILVSPNDTPISLAIKPLAVQKDVLFITGAAAVKGSSDNTFNMSDVVTPQTAFGTLAAKQGVQSAVILINKDNPAFGVIADAFRKGFEASGGKVLDTISVAAADTDFSSVITNVVSKHPSMLYIASLSEQSGNIIRQMSQAGATGIKFGGSSAWQKQVYDIAGKAAVGAMFARNWAPSAAGDSEFESKYQQKYNEKPDTYAAIGYQTAWLVASVVDLAKQQGKPITGASLAALMPDAAGSATVKQHGPIKDFALQRTGIPVYPGVPATFSADGTIVALSS